MHRIKRGKGGRAVRSIVWYGCACSIFLCALATHIEREERGKKSYGKKRSGVVVGGGGGCGGGSIRLERAGELLLIDAFLSLPLYHSLCVLLSRLSLAASCSLVGWMRGDLKKSLVTPSSRSVVVSWVVGDIIDRN